MKIRVGVSAAERLAEHLLRGSPVVGTAYLVFAVGSLSGGTFTLASTAVPTR